MARCVKEATATMAGAISAREADGFGATLHSDAIDPVLNDPKAP
jgi:hypothetical protein